MKFTINPVLDNKKPTRRAVIDVRGLPVDTRHGVEAALLRKGYRWNVIEQNRTDKPVTFTDVFRVSHKHTRFFIAEPNGDLKRSITEYRYETARLAKAAIDISQVPRYPR